MPRLDVWLVEEGFFSSRQAAKRAIRTGLVTVNGSSVKPSKQVSGQEKILVSSEARDLPQGYSKLKQIDEITEGDLVDEGDLALDIGSSAGGFLYYLDEQGATAIGIEISAAFIPKLKKLAYDYERISLIEGDAFSLDIEQVCGVEKLDLLLIDVTTEIEGTVQLIERYSPLLKKDGKLVAAFKSRLDDDILSQILPTLTPDLYSDIETIVLEPTRQEFHLIAKRH
jgi:23S rRNA (cytidine1920-2'-O)/16S rRNA (cytidine1409-2'-O)-methyltransferase